MPLFSFLQRNSSASREPVGMASPAEQVQAARVRARRRLIGAVVLLGVGIVGFPLLFETQPRPLPVEVSIEIPRKDGGAPVVLPSRMAPATSSTITESAADAGREVLPPAMPAPAPPLLAASTPRPVASAPAAPIRVLQDPPRPAPPKETPPARDLAKEREAAAAREAAAREAREREAREAARQKELAAREAKEKEAAAREREAAVREAKEKEAAAREAREKAAAREALKDTSRSDTVEKRYIVQVGAFADAAAASEARARAEKVGVRTYTQVIETDAGRRIRVRVGPFNSREEADKALGKLRAAGLPTALLPQ
jgi:DedD protein